MREARETVVRESPRPDCKIGGGVRFGWRAHIVRFRPWLRREERGVQPGEKVHVIERRLGVATWYEPLWFFEPAPCSQEFRVRLSALGTASNAQASLQEPFDRHECELADSSHFGARVNTNVLLRQEPDEEEEEDGDDRKEEDDDEDDETDGYSE
jgi:hypothetical protein